MSNGNKIEYLVEKLKEEHSINDIVTKFGSDETNRPFLTEMIDYLINKHLADAMFEGNEITIVDVIIEQNVPRDKYNEVTLKRKVTLNEIENKLKNNYLTN